MFQPEVRLTAKVHAEILAYVRAGAYPHIAAQAAGVPRPVFRRWMARGPEGECDAALDGFRAEVRRAAAQVRARAEIEVHQKSPLMWLKHGPGRERSRSPGWTNPARPPALAARHQRTNFLHGSEGQVFVQGLLEALDNFPDARAATAPVLNGAIKRSEPRA